MEMPIVAGFMQFSVPFVNTAWRLFGKSFKNLCIGSGTKLRPGQKNINRVQAQLIISYFYAF